MARSEREKRMLKALAGVVGVAGVLGVFVTVFANWSKDKSGGTTPPVAAGSLPAAVAPKPQPSPSPTPAVAPFVFRGVDPFKPLVNTNPAGSQQTPAPSQSTQTPAGPASAVVGGKTVALVDIFKKNGNKQAHVTVDATEYTAAAGDNFVGDYVLVAFADPCVQFAWRDQSFRLCVQPGSGG